MVLGRSRIATFERLFEGTDEISLGQTCSGSAETVDNRTNRHVVSRAEKSLTVNVAERLAPGQKTVSFCQCPFHTGAAKDNEAGMTTQSRAHSTQLLCDEPRPVAYPSVDNRTTTTVLSPQPVDNYVDSSSSSFCRPWSGLKGVLVIDS